MHLVHDSMTVSTWWCPKKKINMQIVLSGTNCLIFQISVKKYVNLVRFWEKLIFFAHYEHKKYDFLLGGDFHLGEKKIWWRIPNNWNSCKIIEGYGCVQEQMRQSGQGMGVWVPCTP